VEDDLRFIQVDCGGAEWTGEENLPFVRVQLAAALRAMEDIDGQVDIHAPNYSNLRKKTL
jgi:hypothetical protein